MVLFRSAAIKRSLTRLYIQKNMIAFAVLFFSAFTIGFGQIHATPDRAYLNGKAELDAGHPDRAVAIWMQGWNELDSAGLVDPRIGFSVIETVTRYEMSHLYEQAAHIYLWGFQATDIEPWAEEYQAELDRLRPLVHPDQFDLWQQLLDDRDPLLFGQLRSFWLSLDPMPSTEYNPRIVEHWERIGYAREHFNLNDRSPYGTDERGLIYVKYGSPDNIYFDRFQMERGRLMHIARQFLPERPKYSRALARAVDDRAARILRMSQYEAWIYFFNSNEISFLFGRPQGIGEFQLLDSMLELLPSDFNRITTYYDPQMGRMRINAAPFLIMSSLHQGTNFDMEYYTELNALYADLDTNNLSQSVADNENVKYRVQDDLRHRINQIDDQTSWLDRNLSALSIDSHSWRFLDQQDNPYFVTALFSGFPEFDHHLYPNLQNIYLRSSVIIGNDNDGVSCLDTEVQRFFLEDLTDEESQDITVTAFIRCSQTGQESFKTLTAELFDPESDLILSDVTAPSFLSTLSGLIALGRSDIELKDPLSSELNQFTSSDLVLGLSSGEIGTDLSDLRLTPKNRFPLGEDIVLFFEVYNLSSGSGPFREYTMDYEIHPIRTRLQRFLGLGQLDRDQSITLTFETQNSRSTQQMELELAGVTEGEYELIITFTDVNSGQTVQRVTQFILEDL